jgi:ribonuclease BN (tRNA processing enzyme)
MDDPVEVEFIGCGDAFGSGGRLQTCISLRSHGKRFFIDCGATSLVAMKRLGIHPLEVDSILITHLHGDHFGGIPFFLLEAQHVSKRERPLIIAGPPGLHDRLRSAMEVFFPGSSYVPWRFPVEIIELPSREPRQIGELTVTGFPVVHGSGASPYALRVECTGRIVAYSGDTEWTDHLIDASRGADLFICEAYTFDKAIKAHLSYQTLLARKNDLACKRIILTHMSDDMLQRLDLVELEHATDGMRITL